MSATDRPPLVHLTWRTVLTILFLDLLLTIVLVLAVVKAAFGAQAGLTTPRAVLEAQAAAWNRGNLEEFMETYWRSDELTFFSTDQVVKGWQATLDRYRTRYQGEGKEMGRLEFSELSVSELAADSALARGRWKLTLKDNSTLGGLFTLILRKIDGQWRIVHDHTSAGSNT
jgi:beta-aspartyl-peptidase (threonine type)